MSTRTLAINRPMPILRTQYHAAIDFNPTLAQTLSMPNQWTRFQLLCLNEDVITLLAEIKSKGQRQLTLFLNVRLRLSNYITLQLHYITLRNYKLCAVRYITLLSNHIMGFDGVIYICVFNWVNRNT